MKGRCISRKILYFNMNEAMEWKHLYGILKSGFMTVRNSLWSWQLLLAADAVTTTNDANFESKFTENRGAARDSLNYDVKISMYAVDEWNTL